MFGLSLSEQKRVEYMVSKLKIENLERCVKGMEFQEARQFIGDKSSKDYVVRHSIFAD